MPRDLFGDVTSPRVSVGSRKWYTVPVSLLVHVALIVPAIVVPLLATGVLPLPSEENPIMITDVVPPDPPSPPRPREVAQPRANPNAAPTEAPTEIAPESSFEQPPTDPVGASVDGGIITGTISVDVPAPPPPPLPVPQEPVRPGGDIKRPERLRGAPPVYSVIARTARIEGTVILQATIGVDGRVQDVMVLRSVPLLDQAAVDAVRQWEYSPTLLNGVPVPVIMTVTVTFTLSQ